MKIIFLILIFLLFKNTTIIKEAVLDSCHIWKDNIFPVFFPFLILTYFMHYYTFISKKLEKFFYKIFKLNGLNVFLTSILSGSPANAKEALNENLSNNEITKIISFSSFASPLFIVETIGKTFLKSKLIGFKLLFIQYLSAIIYGITIRDKYNLSYKKKIVSKEKISFSNILQKSILSSLKTLFLILGSITITNILLVQIRPFLSDNIYSIISGFFEITTGIRNISKLNISLKLKEILSIIYISFNGISIHMQLISVLGNKLNYKFFLKSKIYIILISVILYVLI